MSFNTLQFLLIASDSTCIALKYIRQSKTWYSKNSNEKNIESSENKLEKQIERKQKR